MLKSLSIQTPLSKSLPPRIDEYSGKPLPPVNFERESGKSAQDFDPAKDKEEK